MYFDEVYHARTATEFLQDWRYGMPHSIYEYTHPHLAKYAMAWSIDNFAGNAVTGTSQLTTNAQDAVAETRWSPDSAQSERDGDRLYVATGTDVQVFDLATREPVASLPVPATAVAVDESAHVLFVAQSDGTITSLDTNELDAMRRDPRQLAPAPAHLRNRRRRRRAGHPCWQLPTARSSRSPTTARCAPSTAGRAT